MFSFLYLRSILKKPHFLYSGTRQHQIRGMKAAPSLIVHYDSQRYLFNCREGTQRLCVQEKVRLSKLSNVFLSRVDWDCMGGLTGMLLTLTDAGVKNIDIHGAKNLSHFVAATRHFVYRTNATVNVHEYSEESLPYSDKNLSVTPVIVVPNKAKKRSFDQFSSSSNSDQEESSSSSSETSDSEHRLQKRASISPSEADTYRKKVISLMFTDSNKGEKAPGHTIEAECSPRTKAVHPLAKAENQRDHLMQSLPPTRPYPAATTYICQGTTLPGKFNKAAALALGIKPGPLYGKLQKGMSITLEDGRVVTRDMVCDPEVPGHVFIVVDCPSVAYIDGLVHSNKFKDFQTEGKYKTHVMIHYVGQGVLEDDRYKVWLNSFDSTTDHIFGSTELCAQTVQFTSHAIGQVKLSMLNPDIFPIPKYNNVPQISLSEVKGLPINSFRLESMAQYNLEPRNGIEYMDRPAFNHTDLNLPAIKEIDQNKEYHEAVKMAKAEAAQVDISEKFPGDDVEIITLGTGSSIPAKYRNVSATLVKIPEYGSIMLDAGEGTYGQMMRRFGIDRLEQEIKDLSCIFISHLHADHHLGVIQLINKWHKATRNENKILTVVGPFVYKHWLSEYGGVEYLGSKRKLKFIRNENLLSRREARGEELKSLNELKKTLGLASIEPVEVVHCRWAYGLSIQHESGWKLVYSGDTRPCNRLVESGKDATLLIHEATLEDGEYQKAVAKRHSTTGEAIEVGKKMNARYTLLNHFSQRYPKLPILSEEQSNVCFSFDMMSIPIKQLPLLPKYTSAIQLAFKEMEEENDIS
ncbi:beta-lactamase-like protein [Gilbertella persicaria]|uniref:beta-lactamase-like protein n=1 Tax=Gilbertella persicaria TaxID=101096 RepID=UPI00221EA9DF|nr:beta-lactamase-like protein [Gilbertella persicaria]KAI8085970.1 beta-lactamase-like protein [Gilbertella persicaria]